MNDTTGIERLPRGVRLVHALQKEPDWSAMTGPELITYRERANRVAGSRFLRVVTGFPDPRAKIRWQEIALPDRVLPVRVYRPAAALDPGTPLPLVLHVHGGGFVGTAAQCDWASSHLAAQLPAVVVSVEHRLLAPGTPLPAAVADGWDVLRHIVDDPAPWGIDPSRVAVAGESTGGLIAALAAIRAGRAGLPLRAQVLVNPACDLTGTMYDYPSISDHAHSPGLTLSKLRFFRELAVPPGTDPGAVSPVHSADLAGLAPALVVVPTVDPLADQGRRYAERLRESGTPVRLTEHPGAPHAFITLPGVVPQAATARAEITEYLRDRLAGVPASDSASPRARAR